MFKRIGYALLIVAVLSATGTHWFVLQSVAWTAMLAKNLRTVPFGQAVGRTFDGEHPCALCKRIQESKQQESRPEFHSDFKRLEFSYSVFVFRFSSPSAFRELRTGNDSFDVRTEAPPLPPPRPLHG